MYISERDLCKLTALLNEIYMEDLKPKKRARRIANLSMKASLIISNIKTKNKNTLKF